MEFQKYINSGAKILQNINSNSELRNLIFETMMTRSGLVTIPQPPMEVPKAPTEVPKAPTEVPKAPMEVPKAPTEVPKAPKAPTEVPTEVPKVKREPVYGFPIRNEMKAFEVVDLMNSDDDEDDDEDDVDDDDDDEDSEPEFDIDMISDSGRLHPTKWVSIDNRSPDDSTSFSFNGKKWRCQQELVFNFAEGKKGVKKMVRGIEFNEYPTDNGQRFVLGLELPKTGKNSKNKKRYKITLEYRSNQPK